MKRILSLTFLSLTLAATHVQAVESSCPSAWLGRPLVSGYVLDGPLQDNAILEEDAGGTKNDREFATWQVAYVYDDGRQITLECRYRGATEPIAIVVVEPVKTCSYSKSKTGAVELGCQ